MESLAFDKIQEFVEENNQDKPQILIVDDEDSIRRMLGRLLKTNENACTLAADAAEARKFMRAQNFDLILCDVNMPNESGIEFARFVLSAYPDTAVIMVSAVDELEVAETAREIGAYGYIIKPFKPHEMVINVSNALHRRKLEIANRSYRQDLEQMVAGRTAELRKSLEGIVQAMALTVEKRDPYTAGHQRRVAQIASAIATEMDFSEKQIEGIYMAGFIHDLGKISVPAEILSKPARLSDIEFALMKTHPQVGFDILKGIEFPWPIAQMILQHHEREDGSGYLQGLDAKEILPGAKILAVADVIETMASHRPYRPALGIDLALEEILRNRGVCYDPEVADACVKVFREKGFECTI